MIERALVAFLKADALVGAEIGDRIEPLRTAQRKPFPRLTYQRVGTPERVRSNDGPCYLAKAIIQLDAWGEGPTGYDDAKLLMDLVRKARGGDKSQPADGRYAQLDGFRGVMAGRRVQSAFLDDDTDASEDPAFGDDSSVFRVTANLTIWFEESRA